MLGQTHPAFVALAPDVGLASLALGMQRIEFLFEPLLGRFAGVAAQRTLPFRRILVAGFFIDRPRRLECTRSLAHAKEPWARPMCAGDPLGNHSQRPIALALVFEPVLAHKDGMGVPAPLPHQARAGLQPCAEP